MSTNIITKLKLNFYENEQFIIRIAFRSKPLNKYVASNDLKGEILLFKLLFSFIHCLYPQFLSAVKIKSFYFHFGLKIIMSEVWLTPF